MNGIQHKVKLLKFKGLSVQDPTTILPNGSKPGFSSSASLPISLPFDTGDASDLRRQSQTAARAVSHCSTHRVRDQAAALVLQAREDGAGHQARGGAAQNHVRPRQLLNFLEDALLDSQVLKDTFLQREGKQFGTETAK